MSRTSSTTVDAGLITDNLLTIHSRIQNGIAYLHGHLDNLNLFVKGRKRLESIAVREYLPALKTLLAEHGRDAIVAAAAELETRLENGSRFLGEPAGDRIDDGYIGLLLEYEILTDASRVGQHPETYLRQFTDRLDRLEATARAVRR